MTTSGVSILGCCNLGQRIEVRPIVLLQYNSHTKNLKSLMVLVNLPTTLVSKGLTSLQVLRRKEYSRVRCDYEGQVPGVNENVTIFRYDEFEITYMFSRPLRYVYV